MREGTYDFADLPLQGDGANPQKPSGVMKKRNYMKQR